MSKKLPRYVLEDKCKEQHKEIKRLRKENDRLEKEIGDAELIAAYYKAYTRRHKCEEESKFARKVLRQIKINMKVDKGKRAKKDRKSLLGMYIIGKITREEYDHHSVAYISSTLKGGKLHGKGHSTRKTC